MTKFTTGMFLILVVLNAGCTTTAMVATTYAIKGHDKSVNKDTRTAKLIHKQETVRKFVVANYANLQADAAKHDGEYLRSLHSLVENDKYNFKEFAAAAMPMLLLKQDASLAAEMIVDKFIDADIS
jgi:hypothetical protein